MPITDPDWVPPIEMSFDVEKPIRADQGLMLAGNPIAAREGKSGSPYERAAWHPYDGAAYGDGASGLIYNFATAGALLSVTSPDFVDGYEYRFILLGIGTGATTGSVTLALKRASDNAFPSGAQDIVFNIAASTTRYGAVIELPLCRLTNRYPVIVSPLTQPTSETQFDLGAATKVQGARFNFPAATTSGLIYMQRRLDCTT